MENLKLYTLANFFIIKTIGKLLQTATLKGLVIIYHLCGEGAGISVKGFADGRLCWSHNIIYLIPLHTALYIFYDPHPFALISSLLIFNFYSLLPSYSVGEDYFFSVPPWETL